VTDRVLVVFDDKDGVAEIAKLFEGLDQARVVTLMKTDGRFVEYVENAAQPGSDLSSQADALAFSA
jgi:hypothetical protein